MIEIIEQSVHSTPGARIGSPRALAHGPSARRRPPGGKSGRLVAAGTPPTQSTPILSGAEKFWGAENSRVVLC
jgi:hypothetical protein